MSESSLRIAVKVSPQGTWRVPLNPVTPDWPACVSVWKRLAGGWRSHQSQGKAHA